MQAAAEAGVLALIPARAGSKGIPGKNIRPLAGKPLIQHTIEAALAAHSLERTVVSTDSEEIAALARACGAETPFLRPAELARDDTPTLPVILHALDWLETEAAYRPDIVVLLQPTAPLRAAWHIDEALALLAEGEADSVVSVCAVPGHYHPAWQLVIENGELRRYDGGPLAGIAPRRQALGATYWRNGAIYAVRCAALRATGSLFGTRCAPYVMPPEVSINLDSEAEWQAAEARLAKQDDRADG